MRTSRALRRLRLLMRRSRAEASMDAEMRQHIEFETADLVAAGWEPSAARQEAARRFGGVEQMKELGRDARGTRWIEDVFADVRFAVRVIRREPALSGAAVATLALGLAATTAIASVVYGVLLRPLPYADPASLVVVWEADPAHMQNANVASLDNFDAWRTTARSFAGMAAVIPASATFTDGDVPERVVGAEVTAGYFRLLGIAPVLGRDFDDRDERSPQSILLSDAYWRQRFAADRSVIGRVRVVAGKPCTIVGVMPAVDPPKLSWLGTQDVWFPMPRTDERRSWGRSLIVIARLRTGVSIGQARAEMASISERLARERPDDRGWSSAVVPLIDAITGPARPALLVLLAGAFVMLAIAVVNVTTLTLSSVRRRAGELAMRRAIGATDRRLFRQLFTQSAVLASAGTAIGLCAGPAAVDAIVRLAPAGLPRAGDVELDPTVLLLTVLVGVVVILAIGGVTAWRGRQAADRFQVDALSSRATPLMSTSGALVTCEVALALALGVAALLMAQSLHALNRVQLGFDLSGVIVARVSLPPDRYASAQAQRAFFEALLDRVRQVRGVEAAGEMSARPLSGLGPATAVRDPSARATGRLNEPVADVRTIGGAATRVLGLRILHGRSLDGSLVNGAPEILVTADLAEQLWPGTTAIGRSLSIDMYGGVTGTVVGVVAPVHLFDPRTPARPALFLSAARFAGPQQDVLVRSSSPNVTVAEMRAAVAAIDHSIPLYRVSTLSALAADALAPDRFATLLLCAFAASALALTAVGVFGVCSADVAARRREIGIRIALGSTRGQILAAAASRTLRRAALGISCGLAGAVILGRMMRALLFEVQPTDVPSFLAVGLLILVIALTATLVPAARAVHRHPLEALREQ